ncbi:pentatricopeptide repeat-containing protein At1g52640, mitochondrial-like [Zingiber officinale]|uniref:pentatricopeptide repeat-containing protein At1g52640, mitochondrial-like n=1 Tax=Zingiber officinale TaxID=94328 RepID=UPI001C4CD561|nr:pentatricopeptide repeat-containing protein At1g52640, mitochondrial-like [Zingiber officinale]
MAVRKVAPLTKGLAFLRLQCGGRAFSSVAALVGDLCRVLSDHRSPHHDLHEALRPFASVLTPEAAEEVLRRCRHLPSSVHRFFLWSSALPGFRHAPSAHNALVRALGAARQFPILWSLLSEHREDGRGGDLIRPETFWLLFRFYARARLPDDAVRAFRRMTDFGLDPDLEDFHQLLSPFCRNGLVEAAQSFFDHFKSRFPVNQKTFSILINGWADSRNPKEALRLFDEMLKRGCLVDVAAYNSLISALCKGGELDQAHVRLHEMQKTHGLHPDAGTYAAFVRAACTSHDEHTATRVLDRMRRHNLVPNVFTYNCVIKLLCEKEKMNEAYELLDEMIERGAKPDVWSYNAILAVHCELHEVNKSLRLLLRMDKDACLPDRHTYNMLLKMLIDLGKTDRAMEVWDGMKGRGFYPAAPSYSVMIHGLCKKKGKVEEACRFFEKMVDEGIPPYPDTCEILRDKLLQIGLREQVGVLACKMKRSTSCKIQELSLAMEGRTKVDSANEKKGQPVEQRPRQYGSQERVYCTQQSDARNFRQYKSRERVYCTQHSGARSSRQYGFRERVYCTQPYHVLPEVVFET